MHALVTEGAFDGKGRFFELRFGPEGAAVLARLFSEKLLSLLVKAKRLSEAFREDILTWDHTGFSVDASVRVAKGDRAGLRRLVRYMARPCVSQERVAYDSSTGQVTLYGTKKWNGIRRVVARYDALTFLALLTLQVPSKGTHMVRYFGAYSVRQRAGRRKRKEERGGAEVGLPAEVDSPGYVERRKRWAELLGQIFEVDPLACPQCGGELRVIAFITPGQSEVLHRILDHLGEDRAPPKATGPPGWVRARQAAEYAQAHPEDFPDPIYEEPVWSAT
jgi:hypothetical protein